MCYDAYVSKPYGEWVMKNDTDSRQNRNQDYAYGVFIIFNPISSVAKKKK